MNSSIAGISSRVCSMPRDPRFITIARGGTLTPARHRALSSWAAECAEQVLDLIPKSESRPRAAVEAARKWATYTAEPGDFRRAALGAHAAARRLKRPAAVAAARACGHAAATAHMADHALGAAIYAVKAIRSTGGDLAALRSSILTALPRNLRRQVVDALASPRFSKHFW